MDTGEGIRENRLYLRSPSAGARLKLILTMYDILK